MALPYPHREALLRSLINFELVRNNTIPLDAQCGICLELLSDVHDGKG